ncbi:hypothetical protein BHE97_02875 [Aeromicrobium sp. PE09-221]|uniref:copper resistance CopC/CopD family protein n=1 Tax=Aeromicrobium sp. PE09-221 TaxID=1898043 RepID=UPI000B3ED563|nr:copper resistance protein CopC [Aeromicrobium sp. PE09-221]OUZ12149.1 hypothetical protein BHE97_02875 [Aeromicrobium sp. PE09-221]
MTLALARRVLLAGLVVVLFVSIPSPAQAHANLIGTDPADGQVVPTSPETVTVTFNEPVSLASAGNQLLDAEGRQVAAEFSVRDAEVTVTPTGELADGTYVLSWRVISTDTHPVTGGITFSVGEPSETVVSVPTVQAEREVEVAKIVAEAIRYAGVLTFAGLIVFLTIAATPVTRRDGQARDRLLRATDIAAAMGVFGALLLIPLTTLWESGESLGALPRAFTLTSPAAAATGILAFAVIVGLVGARRPDPALSGVGAGLALGSLVVVGHTRSFGPSWMVLGADLVHVAAAAVWLGGLVGLLVLLAQRPRSRDAAVVISRFSVLAAWSVALLLVAAVALYWRTSGSLEGLWTTTYGQLVTIKSALTLLVLAVAAWNRRRLVPLVERSADARTTLRRTVAIEASILALVVMVTGVLVSTTPREQETTPPAAPTQLTLDLGDITADVRVTPGDRGVNSIEVDLTDADGRPVAPVEDPELTIALDEAGLGPFTRPLAAGEDGHYEATADFALPGTWTLRLSVRISEFEAPVVSGEVEIP